MVYINFVFILHLIDGMVYKDYILLQKKYAQNIKPVVLTVKTLFVHSIQ